MFGKRPRNHPSAPVMLTRGSLATESHGLDGPMTPAGCERPQVFASQLGSDAGDGNLSRGRPVRRPWHACQGGSRLQGREALCGNQLLLIKDARRFAARALLVPDWTNCPGAIERPDGHLLAALRSWTDVRFSRLAGEGQVRGGGTAAW